MSEPCKTCRFYDPILQNVWVINPGATPSKIFAPYGHCHRFPPTCGQSEVSAKTLMTVVGEENWCGEHERKTP